MAVITWDRKYDVGVRKIDRQHKKIVDILNYLYDLQDSDISTKDIQKVFDELRDYIQKHFEEEEKYILENSCPDIDTQKTEHTKFIDTVCSYQRDLYKHKTFNYINLFNYIWDWLAHHILVVDKECMAS
jgi:hemerythrin-like metal-binding protein